MTTHRFPIAFMLLAACLVTGVPVAAPAKTSAGFFPGTDYDTTVPTLESVLGYDWAEKISTTAEAVKYLEVLAETSGRAALFFHGETWEGRPLCYLVIGSEARLAELEALKSGLRELAHPLRLTPARKQELLARLPVVTWINSNIHGNEPSGTDAALFIAYHLLAARGDSLVERIFANSLIVIDPLQNPDGRDHFVNHVRRATGRWPAPDQRAAEHRSPWPGGRVNHYSFDMNRDWFLQTQLESRARVKTYLQWYPHIVLDLHEMGTDRTYYFPPPAPPVNPLISRQQAAWNERIGRNNARWFDKFGIMYWTGELFDAFYPGYGGTWPTLSGSVGMTFEQASSRGLVALRSNETVMTYRQTVRHHAVASFSTAELAAAERESLLRDYLVSRTPPAEIGPGRAYLIPADKKPYEVRKLVDLLLKNGINVETASRAFTCSPVVAVDNRRIARKSFAAGTYVVPARQEAYRLAANLLETQVDMDKKYIQEQERRLAAGLGHQVYDVTAWSLPLSFGIECFRTGNLPRGEFLPVTEVRHKGSNTEAGKPSLAYVLDGRGNEVMVALAELMRRGVRVYSSDKQFSLGSTDFARGSLIVPVHENQENLQQIIADIENSTGARFYPTDSGWMSRGVNFGSPNVNYLPQAKVVLAWGEPTHSYSAGWCRYVLEQQYGVPVTAVRAGDMARLKLERYNVLVFPRGWHYPKELGSRGMEKIKQWVSSGGTLVTIGGACDLLLDKGLKLLEVKKEYRLEDDSLTAGKKTGEKKKEDAARVPATEIKGRDQFLEFVKDEKRSPRSVPGVMLRIRLDPDHWLSAGYDSLAVTLAQGNNIFVPLKRSQGRNIAYFAEEGRMLLSGYAWRGPALSQLAFKPYLMYRPVGEGHVVAFTEDVNFRAMLDGVNRLFLNAVLLGPGH
ncbi:MAG: M14 family zinc carboxypeptidase [Gemmatimonadota bacterium]|nr:M14 family zinc carboxypeptidase [Gemmatimonadota bacterium]